MLKIIFFWRSKDMLNKIFKFIEEGINSCKKNYLLYRKTNGSRKVFSLLMIFWAAISLWYCSKAANDIIQPELQEKKVKFTGRVTGTFMRKPLSGVKVSIEIENESKGETMTDANGFYSIILNHKPVGPKAPKIIYRARGGSIRFPRETGYYGALIKDEMQYDFDCVENYGDGANFDLKLYRKLNVDEQGNPIPTYRYYPDFPKNYIIRTKDITDYQYKKAIEGIKKMSAMSRGAIPEMEIITVSEEPRLSPLMITHEWVDRDKLFWKGCAEGGPNSADPYSNAITNSKILYWKKYEPCTGSSLHEMMHAMMRWVGLDNFKAYDFSYYQFSLQIYFTYKRYPKHTFENMTDKDFKR